ncbi:MAG: hypothetical protein J0M17_26880, partial [Planctomycetes bacterium]|nr:hypothetical protein [Planctomycetota bacterium]
ADADTPQEEKWLLVMTDIRGRSESIDNTSKPQLLGFRVYRSVMEDGIPRDRIIYLQRVLHQQAINIGDSLGIVTACAERALAQLK